MTLFSINEAARQGMERVRKPNWANKLDHLKIDIIDGNRFRLIVKVNFAAGVVAVRWFGTHAEYDKINVAEV